MNGETLEKRMQERRKEYAIKALLEEEPEARAMIIQKYTPKLDHEMPMGNASKSSPGFLPMMFDQT